MSSKKIFFLSALGGLIIGVIVIVAVKQFSAPGANQSASVNVPGWIEVAPSTRLFTASFPVSPERAETELPVPGGDYSLIQELHTATDAKGNIYHIATVVYPQPFSAEQSDDVLDAALQGMTAAAAGSTLLESTTAKFNDLPAKTFMIQDKDGHYHQGEMFLKDRVLYQAFITYDAGDLADEDLSHFLDAITPTVDTGTAL